MNASVEACRKFVLCVMVDIDKCYHTNDRHMNIGLYIIEYGDDDYDNYYDDDKVTIPYPVAVVTEVADSEAIKVAARIWRRSGV